MVHSFICTQENEPINEFTTEGYVTKAFPALFPTGNNDLLHPRGEYVTKLDYFQYLMRYHDGRFAKHPRFRFFVMNTILRHQALSSSNVFVKNITGGITTVQEIREKLLTDKSFVKNVMAYSSKLRSTKSYWSQRCGELLSMVEQLGKPAFFFTLSAADYRWPDLFKVLVPNRKYSDLTTEERMSLVNQNPILVAHFIQFRVETFVTHVMKPIFKVSFVQFYSNILEILMPFLLGGCYAPKVIQPQIQNE